MTYIQRTILIALALLIVLCVIVGAVLRRHIGGFIETVAREAREQEARDAEEAERSRKEKSTGA